MLGLLVWLALLQEEEPPPARCTVDVVGMPVSVMSHHRLVVGDGDKRPLVSQLEVEVGGEALRLRVLGLRYRGERWISRQECEATGAPLALTVEPLPAHVMFPCPPRGLTVECPLCPGEAGARVYLAEELPPIEMESWSREVDMLLRAPGFHRELQHVVLHPGPNTVHAELEPL
ncbi:hypothetical protein [Paraliomyxa miuraensis]|uniref:hypothetical protein n=1 Tax=Paraliomyxa miuraensis TaxID=376150 RepID=UPI00224E1C80|nr:hypothetical protein [Paraliomyxa miuraensis]MCX4242926.1 hypothetical protein [Paraliomyxa miuraensis]